MCVRSHFDSEPTGAVKEVIGEPADFQFPETALGVMWSRVVSVASAAYAGSQRIVALSDARADLIAEYSPGKVTDEWLNWVDVVGTGDDGCRD